MILLIVDDETPTRSGLRTAIDWASLGISRVIEASDGEEGLQAVRREHPDIILSDVRMPRMDGVTMLEKVRAVCPETVFIFMSGFSDKDYLMAAIRLGAVSYVEKPLNFTEVRGAVSDAVQRCLRIAQEKEAITAADTVRVRELALKFTDPSPDAVTDRDLSYFDKYGSADVFSSAATLLLSLDQRCDLPGDFLPALENAFHERLKMKHLHFAAAQKHPYLFVFHLFRKDGLSEAALLDAAESLLASLSRKEPAYIAAGPAVKGVRRLYSSYSSAVLTLQHAFFFPPGTILYGYGNKILTRPSFAAAHTGPAPEDLFPRITEAWSSEQPMEAQTVLSEFFTCLSGRSDLLVRQVRTLYFRLAGALSEIRAGKQFRSQDPASSAALDSMELCFCLGEMHRVLVMLSASYFEDLKSHSAERSVADLIRNYIMQHYADPLLSTKEISDHVNLSASYACTVFKNETGKTLNQFITEFRMEKAKELLRDPRSHITGIAQLVGYNDGNYFGKAFKKYTGLSPSEYREGNL